MLQLPLGLGIAIASVAAYLLGSINFAIIIGRCFAKKDIRDFGSGNAGMTNVLRTFGKLPALLTTLGDFLKGVLAILLGELLIWFFTGAVPHYAAVILLLPGLLGHCFPVFYGFRGGKGILVCAGMICITDWRVLLIILSVFLVTVAATRFVSLGSILAAVAFPVTTLIFCLLDGTNGLDFTVNCLVSVLAGGIVIFMHRGNVVRLLKGTESKLSFSKAGKEMKK